MSAVTIVQASVIYASPQTKVINTGYYNTRDVSITVVRRRRRGPHTETSLAHKTRGIGSRGRRDVVAASGHVFPSFLARWGHGRLNKNGLRRRRKTGRARINANAIVAIIHSRYLLSYSNISEREGKQAVRRRLRGRVGSRSKP